MAALPQFFWQKGPEVYRSGVRMAAMAMSDSANLWGESPVSIGLKPGPGAQTGSESLKRMKPIDRSQTYWGAIDIEKLIEADHPARGIWAMVMSLDLRRLESKIKAVEGKAGQSTLNPRLLMALWIYSYSEGNSSARELSRMCGYEPGCQWLTGMQTVNHHTLGDFRVAHKEDLDAIFTQVLGLLSNKGLIEMKRITQDGTKIRANAKAGSFQRQERLQQHLQLAREQVDLLSNPESEPIRQRMIQARKRARVEKQHRLEEALKELEQIQRETGKEVRVSSTDPDARVMKQANGGFAPSYNVQISTDAANGIILGVEVTQAGTDCDQLISGIDRVEANTGRTPEQVLVDGNYTMKNANIEAMDQRGIDLIGPVSASNSEKSLQKRGVDREFYPDRFGYDAATDTFRCPAGRTLLHIRAQQREGRTEHTYRAATADCNGCAFRTLCCPANSPRSVVRIQHSPAVHAFRKKMETDAARQIYKTRAQTAEFPHAWIKEKIGLRQFRLRGRLKVQAEAVWACLTYNVQQWLRLIWRNTAPATV